jgi:hypothetical protein
MSPGLSEDPAILAAESVVDFLAEVEAFKWESELALE